MVLRDESFMSHCNSVVLLCVCNPGQIFSYSSWPARMDFLVILVICPQVCFEYTYKPERPHQIHTAIQNITIWLRRWADRFFCALLNRNTKSSFFLSSVRPSALSGTRPFVCSGLLSCLLALVITSHLWGGKKETDGKKREREGKEKFRSVEMSSRRSVYHGRRTHTHTREKGHSLASFPL